MIPVAIQIYSLRDEAKKDLKNVLAKIADMGYKFIESSEFYGLSPKDYKKLINSYGLEIISSHSAWATLDNVNEVAETVKALGLDIAVAGFGPDDFKDIAAINKTADTINILTDKFEKLGLKLFLHNHYWEFDRLDGKIKYHYIAELCPNVFFEIDTYWAANYGTVNPVEELKFFADRTIFLHVKDGCFEKGHPNLAVGSGRMDFKSIIKAVNGKSVRSLIVEFDSCATDIFKAVEESFNYLNKNIK